MVPGGSCPSYTIIGDHRKRLINLQKEKVPKALNSEQVYERIKHLMSSYRKKRSIFFDLPYWKCLFVRHCLDVIHIKINVCDSIIGILLNIPGKTKDNFESRLDMVKMGLRK